MPKPPAKKDVKIGEDTYGEIPKESVLASKWLTDLYVKLGRPKTPFTKNGAKLMDVMISVWEDLYPIDSKIWQDERRDHLKAELPISEQVSKRTGRSLASYPYPLYRMMKTMFPDFKPGERKNCMKLVRKWPMFRLVQKI